MENEVEINSGETGQDNGLTSINDLPDLLKRNDEQLYEIVQFKLSIISPAVYETHNEKSNKAYLKKAAGKTYTMPDNSKATFGLSTLERWVKEYKEKGIQALITKERCDKGFFRKLKMNAQMEIIQMVREYPEITCVKLLARLIDKGIVHDGDVSVDTVSRFVISQHLRSQATDLMESENRIRYYFLEPEAGYLWESDTMYLTKIQVSGKLKWVYLQGIMDNHSRLIVSQKCFMADNALNFQEVLYNAVKNYGIPVKAYCDNGSPYIDSNLKRICDILGIVLIHTRANDGASKGACERFWRTLDMDISADIVLDHLDTLEKIQQKVDELVYKYNHRTNRGVNGIPRERYDASEKRHPMRHPASTEELDKAFLHTKNRTVCCGAIQQNGVMYELPDELRVSESPKKIQIFYNPRNVEGTIFTQGKDGKEYRLHVLDKEKNAGKKRNTGGRTAELKENASRKAAAKMTKSEAHAEQRYQRRQEAAQRANNETPNEEVPEASSPADSAPIPVIPLDYTSL